MYSFCTISTSSHLYKTYALADSISKYGGVLFVLNVNENEITKTENCPDNIIFCHLSQIESNIGKKIIEKYRNNPDKLRWALKPVFLNYLLNNKSKIIYVDNDICFYGDFTFLFNELEFNAFLLTPHFYKSNPLNEQNWLEANYRVGLYNAGFIAVNKNANKALEWWADCCLYNIKKSYWRGLFDDQKYLDLLPILFDNIKIIKNTGCNLAGWNYKDYSLQRNPDNGVIINDNFPLIFIHFADLSIIEFSNPKSFFYHEYDKYVRSLKQYKPEFIHKRNLFSNGIISSIIYYLKWRFIRMFESK